MELLVARKPFRSGNELLSTGDKFLIEDGQGLVDRGYARRLTQNETRTILEEYVQLATGLFTEETKKKTLTHERGIIVQERLL